MQAPISFSISGQQLWLSPLKAIYWESEKLLIVSDLHFGKTGHFRKSGIAVPQHVYRDDLQRLFSLVQYFQPETILVVGDFFTQPPIWRQNFLPNGEWIMVASA